jgi:hypothetical protein
MGTTLNRVGQSVTNNSRFGGCETEVLSPTFILQPVRHWSFEWLCLVSRNHFSSGTALIKPFWRGYWNGTSRHSLRLPARAYSHFVPAAISDIALMWALKWHKFSSLRKINLAYITTWQLYNYATSTATNTWYSSVFLNDYRNSIFKQDPFESIGQPRFWCK